MERDLIAMFFIFMIPYILLTLYKKRKNLKLAIFEIMIYIVFLIQIYYSVIRYREEEQLFIETLSSKIIDVIYKNSIVGFSFLILALLLIPTSYILFRRYIKKQEKSVESMLLYFIWMTQFFIIVRSIIILDIFSLLISILVVMGILFNSKIENFLKSLH